VSARPYANPYVAGVALGVVLLACLVLTGRGLGASGAFAGAAAVATQSVAPQVVEGNRYFQSYLVDGGFASDWLVFELLGVLIGAALSALLAGRWRPQIERGTGLAPPTRLLAALLGGIAMGIGAMLARGCTSGQALSGGALLSVGSWGFMLCAFAAAYLFAPLLRNLWR
jgi:uncharacterized membrane protein YedE/YeeE